MRKQRSIILTLAVILTLAATPKLVADEVHTVKPLCFKSIWLAKWLPLTLIPSEPNQDMQIPFRMYPFVSWGQGDFCEDPVSAEIRLTLTCEQFIGGGRVVIGPQTFSVATPTNPGLQLLQGNTLNFTIPATVNLPDPPLVCTLEGEYEVTWPMGVAIGKGDTQICIVKPSSDDPTEPRLNMERIATTPGEYAQVARRGDQVLNFYFVENNDPVESVSLTFSATSNQVARMPTGDNSINGLFSITNPDPGTANFPNAFPDQLETPFVPLGDPAAMTDTTITRTLELAPFEIAIIPVLTRSFGTSAVGSACELLAKVEGEFSDGSPAVACAGSALMVDDVEAQNPLCEVTDTVRAADTAEAGYSVATYYDTPYLTTHAVGNVSTAAGFGGGPHVVVIGDAVRDQSDFNFGDTSTDYMRTAFVRGAQPVIGTADWSLTAFDQSREFAANLLEVSVRNLPAGEETTIPLIAAAQGDSDFRATIDLAQDSIALTDLETNQEIAQGSYSGFLAAPPEGVIVDHGTARTIAVACPDANTKMAWTDPPAIAELIDPQTTLEYHMPIFDPRTGEKLPWTASSDSPLFRLPQTSGEAGTDLEVELITEAAEYTLTKMGAITITVNPAVNSPLEVPVATRRAPAEDGETPGGGFQCPSNTSNKASAGDVLLGGFLLGSLMAGGYFHRRRRRKRD